MFNAHLENEHNVLYPADASAETRAAIASCTASDLMRYLRRPTAARFTGLTLLEYFEIYIVIKKQKDAPFPSSATAGKWLDQYSNIISTRTTEHVCRIHFKSPAVGDLFYLRLLLHKVPARSFTELRTVHTENRPPVIHPTFHDAARSRGLVTGDVEYFICMREAVCFQAGNLLRGLLVTLILDGGPAPTLWRDFQDSLIEDLRMSMTRVQAIAETLRQIDLKLQLHGKDNQQVNLPPAIHQQSELQRTRGAFDRLQERTFADENEPLLTLEQRAIYSTNINAVSLGEGGAFMADSPAGTGKNFHREGYCSTFAWEWTSCSDSRFDWNCSPPIARWLDGPLHV